MGAMMDVIEMIKEHEGFRSFQYIDIRGFSTIGYGTKLPLTKEEAEILLKHRLNKKIRELIQKEPFYLKLPKKAQAVIADMAYQLGVGGVLGFKKMWEALKKRDYKKAADEMLDSVWAKQTPNRAKELANIIRNLG